MIRIYNAKEITGTRILNRSAELPDVSEQVRRIISDVRENGDRALYGYTERFDGVKLASLEVGAGKIDEAYDRTGEKLKSVMRKAKENIAAFHEKQKRNGYRIDKENGIVLGQRVIAVDRAGVYVPGGTAAYPSTVLMDVIPAKIAGVGEIVMVTPPGKNGEVPDAILAAAKIAGVDRVFSVGGAQAIAALAYGTESVPRVDKIVGPGNAYVAEAKRQVYGAVSVDMIAGPSEILIISDEKTDPRVLAADMLSQAEHDRSASAVLVTTSRPLGESVAQQLEAQIPLLERREIARESIDKNGKIIITDTLTEAARISNSLAPEHLQLCVEQPFQLLELIRHAGSVFLGRNCPEPLGDYMAGPNHTLPTGGTARFSSPLSVDDFCKSMQYSYFTQEALAGYKDDVAYFARAEGLTAHAKSALIRDEIK